jgi:hypothetical protein
VQGARGGSVSRPSGRAASIGRVRRAPRKPTRTGKYHARRNSPSGGVGGPRETWQSPSGYAALTRRRFALKKKYPGANREWGWQYVFPAARRSIDPRSGIERRHPIGPTRWGRSRTYDAGFCTAGGATRRRVPLPTCFLTGFTSPDTPFHGPEAGKRRSEARSRAFEPGRRGPEGRFQGLEGDMNGSGRRHSRLGSAGEPSCCRQESTARQGRDQSGPRPGSRSRSPGSGNPRDA